MQNFWCCLIGLFFLFPMIAHAKTDLNSLTPPLERHARWNLKARADKGQAQAQLDYAKAIIDTNSAMAANYAQRAANQNMGEAWFWMAENGLTDNKSAYYERAATLGFPDAFLKVFDASLFTAGQNANPAKAKHFADIARRMKVTVPDSAAMYQTIDLCAAAGSPMVPPADRIRPEQKRAYQNMDCEALKRQMEWQNYRLCVIAKPQIDTGRLVEIYANGWGTPRNPKLAIAMLCHSSNSAVDLQQRVAAVYAVRNQPDAKTFSSCDYVTDAAAKAACAAQSKGTPAITSKE